MIRDYWIGRNYKSSGAGTVAILKSAGVGEVVTAAAEVIAERARALAPVDSGEYRESIRVVTDVHEDRVAAHVGTHAPYGLKVEAAHAPLRKALG